MAHQMQEMQEIITEGALPVVQLVQAVALQMVVLELLD
jgi:hypothetical protein